MSNVIDVSPELLQKVRSTFEKEYRSNIRIKELYKKIQNGSATYVEADDFAVEVGSILANAFGNNLSSDVLPDGKMYYNIAKAVIEPMMINNYDLVSSVAQQVQTNMNKAAGVGIKAIVPKLNQDRVDGIINGISTADNFDSAKWRLGEPIVIFSQSIIIDSIRENAKFQYDAGLGPKIVRQSTGKCCDWCNQVVGSYEYPDVPKDVYKRHDYCRCKVDYVLTRYRRNVHNNNKGKRRYVQDEYGGYVKTKEARIEKAKQMQATEKSRKEAARQKRIETWKKKNENNSSNNRNMLDSNGMTKYNNSPAKKLKQIYDEDVAAGWISPLVSFEEYLVLYNRINNEIIGKTTSNGLLIKGQTRHFMQRLAGTMVDPKILKEQHRIVRRSGVELEDVMEVLFEGTPRKPVLNPSTGKTSVLFIGKNCEVSINPDTGELIQCNPRKNKQKNTH